jgi:DNA-binding transcriptional LysR family regulator
MDVTIKNLRYFVAAAQEGGFTAAAHKLRVSQPSISSAVDQLEDSLQVQLFLRRPSWGIELTQNGRIVFQEALRLLGNVDEFKANVGSISSKLSGQLSIGCFINLAPVYLPGLMKKFYQYYPDISVVFRELHHGDLLERLHDGRIEMALTFDLEIPHDCVAIEVAVRHPQVMLPIDHELAQHEALTLEMLAKEHLILMDLPHTNAYFLSLFHSVGLVPRIGIRTRSFEMLRCLVGGGFGYGLVNLRPVNDVTYDGSLITSVPLKDQLLPLKIVLLYKARLQHRRIGLAFIEHAKAHFRNI